MMQQRSCRLCKVFDQKAAPWLPSLQAHALLLALQQTFWATMRMSLSFDRFPTGEMGFMALPCLTGVLWGCRCCVRRVTYAMAGGIIGNDIKLLCRRGLCQYKYNYFKSQHFQWFQSGFVVYCSLL